MKSNIYIHRIEMLVQNCLRFSKAKMRTETTSALEYAVAQLNLCNDALEKEIQGFCNCEFI